MEGRRILNAGEVVSGFAVVVWRVINKLSSPKLFQVEEISRKISQMYMTRSTSRG